MGIHFNDPMDLPEAERKEFEEKWGGYNDLPPNFTEITEAEYAESEMFTYHPQIVDHRQMYGDMFDTVQSADLYIFHGDVGYCAIPVRHKGTWKEGVCHRKPTTLRYFKFYLCDHELEELSPAEARKRGHNHFGMCYHVYACKKCDYSFEQDSSG